MRHHTKAEVKMSVSCAALQTIVEDALLWGLKCACRLARKLEVKATTKVIPNIIRSILPFGMLDPGCL